MEDMKMSSSNKDRAGIRTGIERADCTVRAVSVATGIDYDTVHAAFAKCGRKKGCRTYISITLRAVRELGFEAVPCDSDFDAKTIAAIRAELPKSGAYLIRVRGHLAGARNGEIVDWAEATRKRITGVWWITEK
jgi:hypothetical protein